MKQRQLNIEALTPGYASVKLSRTKLLDTLSELESTDDVSALRKGAIELKSSVAHSLMSAEAHSNGDSITFRRDILVSELDQIIEARTIERAKYYLKRLQRGVAKTKTSKLNDINLHRWKEHSEIVTDSLWVMPKRDSSGAHLAWYWGNFVPQIPHQLILRYTKKGDWVLDPFVGSGTTMIECRRLGRHGIGIELNPDIAARATELVEEEEALDHVRTRIITGDARTIDARHMLGEAGIKQVQLLVMHPPYHDIISFSEDGNDLSNAKSNDDFLKMFGEVLDNADPLLERGRYFCLVVGDKYSKGEWVPLGFYCMNEVLKRNYSLKSIVVKNFEETRGKRDQKQLWRYRALVGGFYIFKHEYIFI